MLIAEQLNIKLVPLVQHEQRFIVKEHGLKLGRVQLATTRQIELTSHKGHRV
jgi:hypothetical protein